MKIGVIDSKRLFDSYYKVKDAEARINEKREGGKKEIEERMVAAEKGRREMTILDEALTKTGLSAGERDGKLKMRREMAADLEKKDREIHEMQEAQEKEVKVFSDRLRAGIVGEINKATAAVIAAEKYDIVFDAAEGNLFKNTRKDFTDNVLSVLTKDLNPATSQTPANSVRPAQRNEKQTER